MINWIKLLKHYSDSRANSPSGHTAHSLKAVVPKKTCINCSRSSRLQLSCLWSKKSKTTQKKKNSFANLVLLLSKESPAAFQIFWSMPVPRETEVPFRENSKQVGVNKTLGSGSIFKGYQKSKGNSYEVEVVLQVITAGEAWRATSKGFWGRRESKLRNRVVEVNGSFKLSKRPLVAFEKSRSVRM